MSDFSESNNLNISVLMACHNRKNKTLSCLDSLYKAKPKNWTLNVYLVDDGCTDGTRELVSEFDPKIKIINGNGKWYWAQSMYQAEIAIDKENDAILWINDDTVIFEDSLDKVASLFYTHSNAILVGQFRSKFNDEITYGGYFRKGKNPLSFKRAYSNKDLIPIDSFNGNFVLFSRDVSVKIGNIDGNFAHAYADLDFGLRAQKIGIPVFLIPDLIGVCDRNTSPNNENLISDIIQSLKPTGTPILSQIRFLRRHGDRYWWVFVLTPWYRIFEKHFCQIGTRHEKE